MCNKFQSKSCVIWLKTDWKISSVFVKVQRTGKIENIHHHFYQNYDDYKSWYLRLITWRMKCFVEQVVNLDAHYGCYTLSGSMAGVILFCWMKFEYYLLTSKRLDIFKVMWHEFCTEIFHLTTTKLYCLVRLDVTHSNKRTKQNLIPWIESSAHIT